MCCNHKNIIILPENGPKAIGPYSLGIATHGLVFTSGQLGLDPKSGVLVEGGIEAETHQVIKNLRGILEAAGSKLDQVIKTTVFLKDINDFATMNAVYAEYFHDKPPVRTTIQVCALPKNALVEIEAVSIKPCDCNADKKADNEEENCDCKCGCKE